jgi:hypothetical protein
MEDCMPLSQPPYQEPSPEVLDLLKEEMRLRFPLVHHRHPDLITTRVHGGKVCVDLWSRTGEWIMSSIDSVEKVIQLEEELRSDPAYRAQRLAFLAEVVAMQLAIGQRPRWKRGLWG